MNSSKLKALIKESLQEVLAEDSAPYHCPQCGAKVTPEKPFPCSHCLPPVQEGLVEGKIQDPTRDEMMKFLHDQFGRYGEEGFADSAEVAMYWFANHYHGGQWSNLYSVLSTSQFSPGPIANGPQPESMEADMYQALEAEFGGNEHQHGTESPHPGEDAADVMQEDGAAGGGTGMGMSVTGAVQGYSTPNAFRKKKIKEEGQPEPYDAETDQFAPGPRDRTSDTSAQRPVKGAQSFTTHYAVSGLEQIPDSTHASKKEALLAAAEFLKGYVTPKSKAAGEKLVKIDNGYAIKHIAGGTVAIATVKPNTLHHGPSLAEAPQAETHFERLDQALTAVEEYVIKNRIQVDTAEHPPNEVDPHGIREPFLYGGIPYGQTKQADYKLLAYKGQKTRKYMHVVIYRTEQGRYELNVYTL